jgi:hypothetical protein
VLNNAGSGSASSSANGIIWAADNGAKAIHMSYGSSSYSQTEQNAVNYAWNKGDRSRCRRRKQQYFQQVLSGGLHQCDFGGRYRQ